MFGKFKAKSGELVINAKQQEAIAAKRNIINALDELEQREIIVTDEEVNEIVVKALGERFRCLRKSVVTNCPNCGAALHNGKCEYCGTTYNN